MKDRVRRYRENFQDEIDSAAQYRAMAEVEADPGVAKVYLDLAAMEEKHAAFWQRHLEQANARVPARRPSWRARVLAWTAKRFGAQAILPTVAQHEYRDRNLYLQHPETRGTRMVAQERSHARILQSILIARAPGAPGSEVARVEGRHSRFGGNALRAGVLGANDGLCSNLALVMGVSGASSEPKAVVIAGLAGLVAGACSMAFGEWISVTSSRELAERELGVERDELEHAPDEEREELELIYQARGIPSDEAKELSSHLLENPKQALDVLSREELGIDPEELGGSAWTAALSSFVLFAIGAAFPTAPFLLLNGERALFVSVAASAVVLFLLGALISVFTRRSVAYSGIRQLVIGLATAALTFGIGRALGVAVG